MGVLVWPSSIRVSRYPALQHERFLKLNPRSLPQTSDLWALTGRLKLRNAHVSVLAQHLLSSHHHLRPAGQSSGSNGDSDASSSTSRSTSTSYDPAAAAAMLSLSPSPVVPATPYITSTAPPGAPQVLSLEPESLLDVAESCVAIAQACGEPPLGRALRNEFLGQLQAISNAISHPNGSPQQMLPAPPPHTRCHGKGKQWLVDRILYLVNTCHRLPGRPTSTS